MLSLESDGKRTVTILIGLGKKADWDVAEWREVIADAVTKARTTKLIELVIDTTGLPIGDYRIFAKETGLAYYLSDYRFSLKSEKEESDPSRKMVVVLKDQKHVKETQLGIEEAELIAKGIYLTRDLINLPASQLGLMKAEASYCRKFNGTITTEVLEEKDCRKLEWVLSGCPARK
jgi:leucyl aminopeptidase